ncbi:hypothetical protein ACIOJD_03165 [Streptomyces sp. NPDC088116]|uniref:hypothetical protein n=1 Tax=Streptomyces sp. NPDC088116 TaxID=3365825 RepID=UPI00381F28DF
MPETAAPFRHRRLLRIGVALAVLLAVAGYVVVQYLSAVMGTPQCVVRATDTPGGDSPSYEMAPDQAANAATISAVGTTRGMPERAITIALATALQESALRNLDHGDRDSLGLFQQRPSKGWGTAAQIRDPVYSAGEFYAHLVKVPGYSRLPLTEAAQRVQRSGFPQAYAKHEPDATLLAAALTGRSAASLTCTAPGDSDVPGDPAKVRTALVRAFGSGVLPAEQPAERARPSGGTAVVSVPVRAASASAQDAASGGGERRDAVGGNSDNGDLGSGGSDNGGSASQRGWEVAQWAVAQSTALRIDEVAYAGRVWSAKEAHQGWRTADGSAADRKTASQEVRIRTAR